MQQRRLRFYRSITFQLLGAFLTLFVLLSAALGYALYSAEQRERDQAILNAAARLQLVATMMRHQALNYLSTPARDYRSYFRDVKLYYQDLRAQVDTFDDALGCFTNGRFETVPAAGHAASVYRYDLGGHPSVVDATRVWKGFRAGLEQALGGDVSEPRLEYAAEYVARNVGDIEQAATALHGAFAEAARERFEAHHRLNGLVVLAAIVLLALILWWGHRTLRPFWAAVRGFERVAQGDFAYRVPVSTRNEIGLMAGAFNEMTARLRALFRLIGKVHEGPDVATALRAVYDEMSRFIDLDWVGILLMDDTRAAMVLDQAHGPHWTPPVARRPFSLQRSCLGEAMTVDRLLRVSDLNLVAGQAAGDRSECVLKDQGFSAALLLPIRVQGDPVGMLVLASRRPFAYQLEQEELVGNLAPMLCQGLHQVMVVQGLVGRGSSG